MASPPVVQAVPNRSAPALATAGIAALLASGCCVAPLVLALVGVSGAWISQLRRIEPYSPWLMALSLVALAVAGWRLYRRPVSTAGACDVDDAACRRSNRVARRWFWLVGALALIPVLVPLAAPWFY
jgi:mercuric ion transport protein